MSYKLVIAAVTIAADIIALAMGKYFERKQSSGVGFFFFATKEKMHNRDGWKSRTFIAEISVLVDYVRDGS